MKRLVVLGTAALMAGWTSPAPAQDRTVIEEMIAAQNPCAGLKTEIAGQTVGIDRLQDVTLGAADAALRGDDLTLSFSGRLACATSGSALLKGDASSAVAASADVSLAACENASVEVLLSDFGGSFAAVVQALAPVLELQLAETARPMIVDACRRLRG